MVNTTISDFLNQIWNFMKIFLHYFEQGYLKILTLFDGNKLKLEDITNQQRLKRPFSEIPGPKGWPIIGNVLDFNKIGGAERFNLYAEKLHKEYGDIVKVQLGPQHLVFVSNPAYYREVVRQEGSLPKTYKPAPTCVFNDMVYKNPRGLFFTDGESWHHGRQLLTKLFLKDTSFLVNIFEPYENIVLKRLHEWVLLSKSNNGLIPTIELDCYRIFTKGISSLCLGINYEKYLKEADVDLDVLSKAAIELNTCTEQLNKMPPSLARLLGLKTWKRYEELTLLNLKSGRNATSAALNAMKSAENSCTIDQFGLIHRLKYVCKASDEEIKIHCTDFLFDISDPVSVSFLWALQALGRNPYVQKKLYEEINRVCQTGESVSYKDLDNMPYLKAVQKEISRAYPTAPFTARVVEHEMVIGGYEVLPKTVLTLSTIVSHHNPDYFPNPDKLWPERWFQSDDKDDLIGVTNQEAYHPWGIGKRACAGRLLASAMIRVFVALVVQNFTIESEEVKKAMKCILYPDREFKIRLNIRQNHLLK